MGYKIEYTRQAQKDAELIARTKLNGVAEEILRILAKEPHQDSHDYKKLKGRLKDYFSRRLNRQHRIVYQILPNNEGLTDENGAPYRGIVRIIRMWTHYE